ncbi:MAG: hypothetical protein KAU16_00990 [Methanophagales archaeon]|nr:hypothetical protein [Methanophagales archaeon]
MALIIETLLSTGYLPTPPEGAVRACLEVRKSNLSEPYELLDGTVVVGEILEIKKFIGQLTHEEAEIIERELMSKKIEFILWVPTLGSVDWLYLTKKSWLIFRDCAILPEDYTIKVKLTEAKYNEETVEIFPKRDVIEG